jgi:hypothetical protein
MATPRPARLALRLALRRAEREHHAARGQQQDAAQGLQLGTFVVVPTVIRITVVKVARSRQMTPSAAVAARPRRRAFALGRDGRWGVIPLL